VSSPDDKATKGWVIGAILVMGIIQTIINGLVHGILNSYDPGPTELRLRALEEKLK